MIKNEDYWNNELKELNKKENNWERRDRYNKLLHFTDDNTSPNLYYYIISHTLTPEDVFIKKKMSNNTYEALIKLGKIDKTNTFLEIIIGHLEYEKTFNELSNELGISTATVYRRYTKSIDILKKFYKEN